MFLPLSFIPLTHLIFLFACDLRWHLAFSLLHLGVLVPHVPKTLPFTLNGLGTLVKINFCKHRSPFQDFQFYCIDPHGPHYAKPFCFIYHKFSNCKIWFLFFFFSSLCKYNPHLSMTLHAIILTYSHWLSFVFKAEQHMKYQLLREKPKK